ncbi:MAG: 5-(carboxyamino)imidazole ribonucleotide synthase [Gaiella sp.]
MSRSLTVGVIGGGQLGRMLGLAGLPLGISCRFLDPDVDACAGRVGELIVGAYDDPAALARLADGCDAVTFEFENVPVEAAAVVGCLPGAAALRRGQDRLVEKRFFRELGIEAARFGTLAETGVPALVKTRRLGYDGKGQRRADVVEELGPDEVAEAIVPFSRELSIIGVRAQDGETRFWPLTENVHTNGILQLSRALVACAHQAAAEELCSRLLEALDYVGVLAVELFEVDGRLLANEFAPRVHNTGHWTLDAAVTSQFENHLRAVLGLPLGDTRATAGAVMVNLIGRVPPLEGLAAVPGARVHLYGKQARPGRKLGHVTLLDPEVGTEQRLLELIARQ